MCIVAIAWQVLDEMPLCLISNRDEFYQRPSSLLKQWENSPIIAGQDLQSGGTWMGITPTGRWAVLTNFRDGKDQTSYSTSRGHLIQSFLESEQNVNIEVEPHWSEDGINLHLCEYTNIDGKKGAITTEKHVINVQLSESQCLELIKALQLCIIDSASIKK
jgi:uncharacterized protein with NRDE domain